MTSKGFRFAIVPAVAAIPSLLAAAYYKNSPTEAYIFVCVGIWAIIVSIGKSYLNDFARTTIEGLEATIEALKAAQKELADLFNYVRIVVGAKSARFYQALDKLPDDPNPGETFFKITRPDLQIKQLVEAVQGYFQIGSKASDERIKVSLMRWNGSFLEFMEWFPDADQPPRAEVHFWSDARTVAGLAYHTKRVVICEDIENDDRYFHFNSKRDTGSMFAYPVFDEQLHEVVFVVNTVSTRVGRFQRSGNEAQRIHYAMDIFAERMILENRLARIKERIMRNQGGGRIDHA